MKTKKTLMKRIRITKTGKIMKKQNSNGHLKRKMDSSRRGRKNQTLEQSDAGHIKRFKIMLGRAGRNIK
jgi:ribosomal protein L35